MISYSHNVFVICSNYADDIDDDGGCKVIMLMQRSTCIICANTASAFHHHQESSEFHDTMINDESPPSTIRPVERFLAPMSE